MPELREGITGIAIGIVLGTGLHDDHKGNQMKYYVYFDSYGHAGQAINEKELAERYNNDPDEFFGAMCALAPDADRARATGHVGTLRFDDENELRDYLESLGDEITGFYGCMSESRPYNF